MAWTQQQKNNIIEAKALIKVEIDQMYRSMFQPYNVKPEWDDLYVAGGAIASLLQQELPKDIDIYFGSERAHEYFPRLIVGSDNIRPMVADVDEKYREVLGKDGKMITVNAITMNKYKIGTTYPIQFITKHFGAPEVIRKTFDFTHCLPYYHVGSGLLFISEHQYDLCVNKVLEVNDQMHVTVGRIDKFKQRGYDTSGVSTSVASTLQILKNAIDTYAAT